MSDELTVEDLSESLDHQATMFGFNLFDGAKATGEIGWSRWTPERGACFVLWTADGNTELAYADTVEELLVEAKRRGLLG